MSAASAPDAVAVETFDAAADAAEVAAVAAAADSVVEELVAAGAAAAVEVSGFGGPEGPGHPSPGRMMS